MEDPLGNTVWCKLLRQDGKPVPDWLQRAQGWRHGLLLAKEERDPIFRRHVLVVRLVDSKNGLEVFPPLLDARLVHMDHTRSVFSGIERDELTRRDVAQSWLLMRGREEPRGACSSTSSPG